MAGIVLRERRPTVSTVLLVVGSLAPSVAWYWLPPVYLLTIAIAAAALLSARVDPAPFLRTSDSDSTRGPGPRSRIPVRAPLLWAAGGRALYSDRWKTPPVGRSAQPFHRAREQGWRI